MHGESDNLAEFSICDDPLRSHENLTIRTYPETHHGFDVPGPDLTGSNRYLGNYVVRRCNPDSAEKRFRETRAFPDRHMR